MHNVLNLIDKSFVNNKLSILIYHQVLHKADPMRPYEPTAEVFDWQMKLISKYYTPVSLSDAIKHLKANTLPKGAICVTFDDGYLNNLTVAQPILAKYKVPATVYIATEFSNGTNMWNDLVLDMFSDQQLDTLNIDDNIIQLGNWENRSSEAGKLLKKIKYLSIEKRLEKVKEYYRINQIVKSLPKMMNPEQVKELSIKGVEIGAHTVSHPILKVLNVKEQEWQIRQSKLDLEKWIEKEVVHFAYPNGVNGTDFDETTVGLVKKAGFESAVITNWGTSNTNTDPFLLPRFTPWDRKQLKFHARLVKSRFY